MPRVAAFRGLGYALDRFGRDRVPARVRVPWEGEQRPGSLADVSDVVCPPYDVVSAEARRELLARDECNAIRLELSPEPDPHAAAARTLHAWLAEGTLERRADASVYAYGHGLPASPDDPTVQGVAARVLLEPWGSGVRPHENTMPGPKADRLALLRATRTQLSPILALYFDRSSGPRPLAQPGDGDEWRARDADGLLHRLVALEPDSMLLARLSEQPLFVADGHHRYETALAYQGEVRADPHLARRPAGELAADWIMMVLVNAELEALEIRPTHRVLLDADPDALGALLTDGAPTVRATAVAFDELPAALEARRDDDAPAFGLALADGRAALLVADAGAVAERMRDEPGSGAARHLDLSVLHTALLNERLGIDAATLAAGERLLYTRDPGEALDRVRRHEAAAAFLVRPTRLEQLAAVATAGDVMPQKSTYFYPKLLTGMVFNPLED